MILFSLSFRLFLKFVYVVNKSYKMETVEITSAKKSYSLHIDGYSYCKHSGKSRRYWNCRNKGESSARAITTGDGETLVVHKA